VLQAERPVKNPGRAFAIAFWIFVVLVIVACALELGAWKRTEILNGPFASAGEGSHAYEGRVGGDIWFRALFVPKGDRRNNIVRSNLQMWVNGGVWGPPNADFATISRGDPRAFSHLDDRLFFTLPTSVANDAGVVITLKYSVRLRERYFTALALSAIAVFVLWARVAPPPRLGRWLSKSLPIFPTASWILVIACIAYAAATLYGWAAGYALPTAMIFRLFPYHLSVFERGIPYAILLFAAAGASCGWLAALKLVQSPQLLRTETGLMRMWRAWSLPVITCLFLFSLSAGGWSGHVRASDINYMSLAGLVPRSDAGAYFSDAFHQAYWGEWDVFGTRRPLAQAFRQFLVLAAQYSYVGTLLIQVGMLAVLTHLVALSITRWRGIWAGIAFVGFMYLLARPFFPTTLTEPPALICTLFSLVFLVEALRLGSLQHAQIALIGMTLALFIRVGSVLTAPFMIICVAIAFCGTNRARFRAFALACAGLVAVVALNAAVGHLYGKRPSDRTALTA
jgi:hypothetical protein